MDDNGHRENGRQKPPQSQWLMQHHPSMKQIMTIMAERDAAIQERNLAISEKKTALAERDLAILQRDSAMADKNNAIKERDNAIATLQYRGSAVNNNNAISQCPPGCQIGRGVKHMHHPQQSTHHQPHVLEQAPYNMGRPALSKGDMQITDTIPTPPVPTDPAKSAHRPKRPKETNLASRRTPKSSKKVIKQEGEDLSKAPMVFKPPHEWKPRPDTSGCSDSWKDQDLGLNQVSFDETTMPVPVCSCTGSLRPCYKWGNGGWQSSCCTTNLSMYPLPAVPNKRHARVGGRKMSGSAFNKLISRLAAEGHDLSNPVDLKDNWAKHGTNRYITIK